MVPIHSALYFLTDSKEVTKKTRVYINLDGFLILAYSRQDVLLHLHDLFGDVVKKVTKKLWIYIKKHGSPAARFCSFLSTALAAVGLSLYFDGLLSRELSLRA